jgi:hypothetical protein
METLEAAALGGSRIDDQAIQATRLGSVAQASYCAYVPARQKSLDGLDEPAIGRE